MQVRRNQKHAKIRLELLGPFRLSDNHGKAIPITSKRSRAIIAILATSKNMEKTRNWLQNTLWCERSRAQSQASLRRELSNIKALLSSIAPDLIWSDKEMIGINSDNISVDLVDSTISTDHQLEILEGFDLKNEENFETWLRDLRNKQFEKTSYNPGQLHKDMSREGQPSLSIWPEIKNLSNEGEILMSGVVDTLFEHLPKLRWLDLINSPWRSAETIPSDDRQIARELNVKYLLKCRCTEFFHKKTLWFTLLNADRNTIVWSENVKLEWPITGAKLTELVIQIVANTQTHIQTAEQLKSSQITIPNLNVNSLVWRARWHMKRLTRKDAELAFELIETALHRSPEDKEALLQKSFIEGWTAWVNGPGQDEIKRIRHTVKTVINMDPLDARPYLLNGILEHWLRNQVVSHELLSKAIELNPCHANSYGHLAACYNCWGKPELAIEPSHISLRLNPLGMENFFQLSQLALSYFMQDEFKTAVEYCDKALAIKPRYLFAYTIKIASLFYSEDDKNYQKTKKSLFQMRPNFTTAVLEWLPFDDRGWVHKLTRPLTINNGEMRF